jgi:cytochrome P450 family 710 subfamily A protein
MIFTTDADISRRVFTYNDPETLLMAVHPSGKNILGEGNLAFMHGPPHKAIRKSFLSLFTRKALATYVELQDGIIREHLKRWQQVEGEREIRLFVRSVFTILHYCCLKRVTMNTLQGSATASRPSTQLHAPCHV